jgi:hypothetical protein
MDMRRTGNQICLIAITLAMMTVTASADDATPTSGPSYAGTSLVMLLSSDEACGLTYNKDAIERFVKHVTDQHLSMPDLGFRVSYEREYVVRKMSPNTLVAHCTQVRETAKLYDFIK